MSSVTPILLEAVAGSRAGFSIGGWELYAGLATDGSKDDVPCSCRELCWQLAGSGAGTFKTGQYPSVEEGPFFLRRKKERERVEVPEEIYRSD